MREDDFQEFTGLLAAAFDILGKTPAAKVVSPTSQALWFQALADYPLPAVRAALGQHIKVGKFTPTPADIVEQIEAATRMDNRPGAEEAWAIALAGQDERDTVVWTAETAEAFRIARPVLESSGPISGRKTFLEAYERLVAAARQAKIPARWTAHLGFDRSQQAVVLERAVQQGLLPAPTVQALLPASEVPESALSDSAREQLAKVKQLLADSAAEREKRLQERFDQRNQDEAEFRRTLTERVNQYQRFIAMADQRQVSRAEADRVQQAGGQ